MSMDLGRWDSVVADVMHSPRDAGTVRMVVARPADLERQVLEVGRFDTEHGLLGDNWEARGSTRTTDGSAHADMQVAVTNARWMDGISHGDASLWPLAGDQLYVDLDLSAANLSTGDELRIGDARFVVTAVPHNGCKRFAERFGVDTVERMSTPEGKRLHLRGIYVRVVVSGDVRPGDPITVVRVAAQV